MSAVEELYARNFNVINFLDCGQSEGDLVSPVRKVTRDAEAGVRWDSIRLGLYWSGVFAQGRGDGMEKLGIHEELQKFSKGKQAVRIDCESQNIWKLWIIFTRFRHSSSLVLFSPNTPHSSATY